jgi:hypothetical protein
MKFLNPARPASPRTSNSRDETERRIPKPDEATAVKRVHTEPVFQECRAAGMPAAVFRFFL